MPDPVVLFVTVILIVPMGYLLLAAPAFLLVKLDIPPVTQLLHGIRYGTARRFDPSWLGLLRLIGCSVGCRKRRLAEADPREANMMDRPVVSGDEQRTNGTGQVAIVHAL